MKRDQTITQFVAEQLKGADLRDVNKVLDQVVQELIETEPMTKFTGQEAGYTHPMVHGDIGWISQHWDLVIIERKMWSIMEYYAGLSAPHVTLGDYRLYDGEEPQIMDIGMSVSIAREEAQGG